MRLVLLYVRPVLSPTFSDTPVNTPCPPRCHSIDGTGYVRLTTQVNVSSTPSVRVTWGMWAVVIRVLFNISSGRVGITVKKWTCRSWLSIVVSVEGIIIYGRSETLAFLGSMNFEETNSTCLGNSFESAITGQCYGQVFRCSILTINSWQLPGPVFRCMQCTVRHYTSINRRKYKHFSKRLTIYMADLVQCFDILYSKRDIFHAINWRAHSPWNLKADFHIINHIHAHSCSLQSVFSFIAW